MWYAKAPPLVFRFLPGLLLVVEFVAPEHLSPRWSIAPGSRDEGKKDIPHVRFTLEGLSFPPRSLCSRLYLSKFSQTPIVLVLD